MTISIHPTARISPLADIEDSTRGTRIVIGANSIIDSFVKIKPAGGAGDLIIGAYCVINSGCILYTGNGIAIGDYVAVAANVVFAPTNHEFHNRQCLIRNQGFRSSKGGILVEDDVWIGVGTSLLDGATLRRGCVVGAMSLVNGEVPEYSICFGNPLRVTGYRM